MNYPNILRIALVPLLLAGILFAMQWIFGLISKPDDQSVLLGVVSLSLLILISFFIIKKIYFNHE